MPRGGNAGNHWGLTAWTVARVPCPSLHISFAGILHADHSCVSTRYHSTYIKQFCLQVKFMSQCTYTYGRSA